VIERGEAYFDIAHDSHRPFIVQAGIFQIKVLGTRFGVRFDGTAMHTLVIDGRVQISRTTQGAAAASATQTVAVLQPGDALAADSDRAPTVSRQQLATLEDALGWRRGELVLNDMTLAEAAAEFNRYNQRKLVLADVAVAQVRVGGRFDPHNVVQFAQLLATGFGLNVREEPDRIIVTGSRTGN
jgi:transmembrane sensor